MDRIRVFEDPRFGEVSVRPGTVWTVTVEGEPLVEDVRERQGLRGPEGVGRVRQGLQLVRRRSFDVEAEYADRHYRLRQTSAERAELDRDGRVVARLQGRQETLRLPEHRPYDYDPVLWEAGADVTDARIGHLLASHYGVGARGAVRRVGGVLEDRWMQATDTPVAGDAEAAPFRSTDSQWLELPEEEAPGARAPSRRRGSA